MNFKKIAKRGVAVLVSAVMVLSLAGCDKSTEAQEQTTESEEVLAQREFDEYCDELFFDVLGDDPMNIHYSLKNPEAYGVQAGEYTWGDISIEEIEAAEAEIEAVLKELEDFDESLLTDRQQLTLDTIKAYFEIQAGYNDLYMMQNVFGVNSGIVANLPINFIEFVFDDEESVKMYLEYMKDTRRYIGQVLDFVRLQSEQGFFMADVCAKANIEQCQKYLNAEENPLLVSFEEKISKLDIPEEKKEEYIAANEEYVREYFDASYNDIIAAFTELMGSGSNQNGLCYFENGKELYTAILREKTSSDMTPEEIIQLLDSEMALALSTIQSLFLLDSTILDQYAVVDFGMEDPQEILEFLSDKMETEFPAPYTKEFVVEYQSKACENEGVLAYYLSARLDQLDYNSIKVNGSLVAGNYVQLYRTLAHEGFPGHLYQITSVTGNEEIPDVCKLFNFIGFTEGYAEYASDYACGFTGYSDELVELMIVDNLYGYALSARIDLGVNYEGWTREDCMNYCEQLGFGAETGESMFETVVSDPGAIVPYAVGHILMRNLRAEAERELDDAFDPVEYNQFVLDLGFVTFDIMEEKLDEYIEEKKAELPDHDAETKESVTEGNTVSEGLSETAAKPDYYEEGNTLYFKQVTAAIPEGFSFVGEMSGMLLYSSETTNFAIMVQDDNIYGADTLIPAYLESIKQAYGTQVTTSEAVYNGLEYTVVNVDNPDGAFVGNVALHCDGKNFIYLEYVDMSGDKSGFDSLMESIGY